MACPSESTPRAEAVPSRALPYAAIALSAILGACVGGLAWAQLGFAAVAAYGTSKGQDRRTAQRWALASWACLGGLMVLWSLRMATSIIVMGG